MSPTPLRIAAALLATLLAGCGPDEPLECPDEMPVLELAPSGDLEGDLVDGDATPIVFGPQGGYHVAYGIRVTDQARDYTMRVRVQHDDEVVADTPYEGPLRGREGCTASMGGFWAFLELGPFAGDDPASPPDRLIGETFELRVDLTTDSGSASVTRSLVGAEMGG